jgi:hypothetical protein
MEKLLESIIFKLQAAQYHYERTQTCLNNPEHFMDPEERLLSLSCEIIAMMLSLQSAIELTKKYSDEQKDSEIKRKYQHLFAISEYLRDFCNYTKHHNIIKTEEQHSLHCGDDVFASTNTVNIVYFIIDEFNYEFKKNKRHHLKRVIDPYFFDDYKQINDQILEIIKVSE